MGEFLPRRPGPVRFGLKFDSAIAPLDTFERNRKLYRDCHHCPSEGVGANYFATAKGLRDHLREAHNIVLACEIVQRARQIQAGFNLNARFGKFGRARDREPFAL